ncbi:MAG: aminopeptidase P family protein [Peptococcaceae bacterium]|nr:aminopeptidase P family protein [Peptococcaceae bacterium]
MKKKNYNITPKDELYNRIARLQERLNAAGLQGALLAQNVDLLYFSGTCQDAHLLVPAQGEPLLMVRKSYERALEESTLEKIIPIKNYHDIKNNIFAVLKGHGPVGLEYDVLPTSRYLRFKEMLAPLETADISGYIREIRMIKSPYEIEIIKEAVNVSIDVYREVPTLIREGMTELELSRSLEYRLGIKGDQGNPRMRAFNQEAPPHVLSGSNGAYASFFDGPTGGAGPSTAFPQGPGFKKLNRNEPILVDVSAALYGYTADHTRIYSLGRVADNLYQAHQAARQIKQSILQQARPGIDSKELYELACQIAAEAGFGNYFMGQGVSFVGHGLGLELDELPVIAKNRNYTMQPGMVLALEPKFVFPGLGTVGVEDTYVMTENGLQLLNDLDDDICVI